MEMHEGMSTIELILIGCVFLLLQMIIYLIMVKKKKIREDNKGNNNLKITDNQKVENGGIESNAIAVDSSLFNRNNFFWFNVPKVEGNGEDADPFYLIKDQYALFSVFDGLGGAGSQKIMIGEETKSSAYYASRLVRDCIESYFLKNLDEKIKKNWNSNEIIDMLQNDFKSFLIIQLKDYILENKIPASKLKSSLIKALPSTLASVLLVNRSAKIECYSFWAGDSRVYKLCNSNGLQQLTKDDLKQEGDAYNNIYNDSKMSNFISPELDFKINVEKFEFEKPSLIFVCSDGCFDYLPSPMDFEYLLLDTMQKSETLEDWSNNIKKELDLIPVGDDCSLCLFYHGWHSMKSLKVSFVNRHVRIKNEYITPIKTLRNVVKDFKKSIISLDVEIEKLVELNKQSTEKLEEKEKEILSLSKSLWENYRETYYENLIEEDKNNR